MKINLNTVLLVLAGLGVFAPDIASVAGWLAAMHVAWLGTVVKGLGLLAAFCSAAPLVVPRLRAFLALLGLATPPGAVAPWDPKRDAGPGATPRATTTTNVVALPGNPTPPAGTRPGAGYGKTLALLVLAGSLLGGTAWAQSPAPLDCGPLGVAVESLGICIVPSSAGGEVFNLKTGTATNVGILLGIAAIHQDKMQLGGGFYCGANLALNAPDGGMCAAMFTIKNYGAAGGGFLVFHDSLADKYVFQGLLLYAGTLHFGGTPSTVMNAKAKAGAEAVKASSAGTK